MDLWTVLVVSWMRPGLIAFATMACAGSSSYSSDNASAREKQLVLAAEDAYVAAEISRNEADLRRLIDDRFVYNAADGTTSGKEQLIRNVLKMNMTGQTISERTVILERDMAIIVGTAAIQSQGPVQAARTSRLRYTSVYVKRKGVWRMLALQMQPRSTQ